MDITTIASQRYAAKAFDSSKRIPPEIFVQIENLLQLSPSSVNIQPWHFIIASTEKGRSRIAKAMAPEQYEYNVPKVLQASHVIVFCAKSDIEDEYIQHITDTEEQSGRYTTAQSKEKGLQGRTYFVNTHRFDRHDSASWLSKQVYLNLGTILLGAALLGLDATPMEGFDETIMDTEFQLREQGYTALVVVALGYHSENDFNKSLPKSRLEKKEIFTPLD